MSTDLILTAIRSVSVVMNNPAFAALGGAVNVQMKEAHYHGAEIDVMGGSFDAPELAQWGAQIDVRRLWRARRVA